MDNNIITKGYLESEVPRGTFSIAFQSSNQEWQKEKSRQAISDIIQEILNNFSEEGRQVIGSFLKIIIFTDTFKETIDFWADQLQRNIPITETETGGAVAKTLRWETNGETFQIIIANADIALALLDDSLDFYPSAKRLMVHEFTHVITYFGSRQAREELVNSWCESAFLQLACTFWEEMQAESIAHSIVTDDPLEPHLLLCIELIEYGEKIIKQAIHDFRLSSDVGSLFDISREQLSIIVAQIGRCLGILRAKSANDPSENVHLQEFIKKLYEKSKGWGDTTLQVLGIFDETRTSIEIHKKLVEIMKGYFHVLGLFPECREDGSLYMKVPYTPDTMPYSS